MPAFVELCFLSPVGSVAGYVSETRAIRQVSAIVGSENDERVVAEFIRAKRGDDSSDALVKRFDHRFDVRCDIAGVRNHAPLVFVVARSLIAVRRVRWSLPGKVNGKMRHI